MQGFIIELKLNTSITVNIINNLFKCNTLKTIYCEKMFQLSSSTVVNNSKFNLIWFFKVKNKITSIFQNNQLKKKIRVKTNIFYSNLYFKKIGFDILLKLKNEY